MTSRTLFITLYCISRVAFGAPDVTSDPVKYLREILKQNNTALEAVDKEFKTLVTEPTDKQMENIEVREQKLSSQRHELMLRQEFLDRLIHRVEGHYKEGGDLRKVLIDQLSDMAVVEASDPQGDSSLWKFMTYLSIAVRDQAERSENLVAFIEGYMKFSSISKPIRPEDYVAVRSYTNGKDFYSAKSIAKEAVGEIVEKRLKELPPGSISTTVSTSNSANSTTVPK
jgi:hypothetical protein